MAEGGMLRRHRFALSPPYIAIDPVVHNGGQKYEMSQIATAHEKWSDMFGIREKVMYLCSRQHSSNALPAGERLMRGSNVQDGGVGHGWSVSSGSESVQASNHDMWLLPVVWCVFCKREPLAGVTASIHLEISVHLA